VKPGVSKHATAIHHLFASKRKGEGGELEILPFAMSSWCFRTLRVLSKLNKIPQLTFIGMQDLVLEFKSASDDKTNKTTTKSSILLAVSG